MAVSIREPKKRTSIMDTIVRSALQIVIVVAVRRGSYIVCASVACTASNSFMDGMMALLKKAIASQWKASEFKHAGC